MIVIPILLHSARTGKVTELHRIEIINTGTGSKTYANYTYKLRTRGKVIRSGAILHWNRKGYSATRLLQVVLRDAYPLAAEQFI